MGLFKSKEEKELEASLNAFRSKGSIKPGPLAKYESMLSSYKESMKGYSHKDQKPYWH